MCVCVCNDYYWCGYNYLRFDYFFFDFKGFISKNSFHLAYIVEIQKGSMQFMESCNSWNHI